MHSFSLPMSYSYLRNAWVDLIAGLRVMGPSHSPSHFPALGPWRKWSSVTGTVVIAICSSGMTDIETTVWLHQVDYSNQTQVERSVYFFEFFSNCLSIKAFHLKRINTSTEVCDDKCISCSFWFKAMHIMCVIVGIVLLDKDLPTGFILEIRTISDFLLTS